MQIIKKIRPILKNVVLIKRCCYKVNWRKDVCFNDSYDFGNKNCAIDNRLDEEWKLFLIIWNRKKNWQWAIKMLGKKHLK